VGPISAQPDFQANGLLFGGKVNGTEAKLTETKKSANEFTGFPTVMNLPEPDPMCMDAAVYQWLTDLTNNAP